MSYARCSPTPLTTEKSRLRSAKIDPQTEAEFVAFIRKKGILALSLEQLEAYDTMRATATRRRRRSEKQTETVTQFQADELQGFEFTLKEGYHDKRQCPLYIVQLTSRVEKATFTELKGKAKMLASYRNTSGCKQAAAKLAKLIRGDDSDYVRFREDYELSALEDFLARVKAKGFRNDSIDASLERFKRVRRADIYTLSELRCALREYLPHKAATRGDDPVAVAERELIGKQLPGFFPTPRQTIEDELLSVADIQPHHDVLEPSCGKGDIVEAIRENHPGANVTAIEFNQTLQDVLSAKGLDVQFADFLEHRGAYDRIVMNPPFESGADIDHVRHAYSLLREGGRVVAIMSEGPFFRADNHSERTRPTRPLPRTWIHIEGEHNVCCEHR